MAVAKEYLYTDEDQLIGEFGKAIGHAARVKIIARLLDGQVYSYGAILGFSKLERCAVNNHLRILERHGLILRDTLPNNLAGFRLDMSAYLRYLNQIRLRFKTTSRLRSVNFENLGEISLEEA
jgi:DNA-binding transcriptional ArsR family regulator